MVAWRYFEITTVTRTDVSTNGVLLEHLAYNEANQFRRLWV
jgi:hypothetical protein